jgi:LacI family transcriptional regulator
MADLGRNSSLLLDQLRNSVRKGKLRSGDFLPTVRDLSQTHGVAFKTVQRALKALENEGLLVSEPRRGYRVQARAHDPNRGKPLAYINGDAGENDPWAIYQQTLRSAIQRAAESRGWSLLAVGSAGRPQKLVMEQLRAANAWGVILDTVDPVLLDLAKHDGMPVVMLDSWNESFDLDTVLQDDYRGGYLGAQHLLSKGHEAIGWLGAINATSHSRLRFAGANAAFVQVGRQLQGELCFETSIYAEADVRAKVQAFLKRAPHPCACLVYWLPIVAALVAEARAAGWEIGRDLEIVGWSSQEMWKSYETIFAGGAIPATVTWSMLTAAECALERLEQRRTNVKLPPVRIHVATTVVGDRSR